MFKIVYIIYEQLIIYKTFIYKHLIFTKTIYKLLNKNNFSLAIIYKQLTSCKHLKTISDI